MTKTFAQTFDDLLTDDFDPLMSDNAATIHAEYDRLRAQCPVARTHALGGYWQLTRYDDIKKAASDGTTFISSVKAVVPSDPRGLRRPPLNFDAPHHTPYRTALERTLRPARLRRLEEALERHAEIELAPMLAAGGGDMCQEFGARFPAWVEVEWLNLDADMAPKLAETAANWVNAWRDMDKDRTGLYSNMLYDMAAALIADRTKSPRDPEEDPASSLLSERGPDGKPLNSSHLLGALRQSLVVGMVAPPILIGSICRHLSEDQALQTQLREEPGLIPAAVEEFGK